MFCAPRVSIVSKGILARRRAHPHRPGQRSGDEVKITSFSTGEVVVGVSTHRAER
jgi:ATP-dependent DNA ligase